MEPFVSSRRRSAEGWKKEHHPPCGIFRTVGIKSLKNTSDREEWKRGSVTVLEQVVERGINMTMG
jgi:hypothetical protein